jgi:hypothetical protein
MEKPLCGAQRSTHTGKVQEGTYCRTLAGASELAFRFLPQPFFAGPHRDLCTRGKA